MREVRVFMEFALARGAAVWSGLERGVGTFSLGIVISLRNRIADLRKTLDTVIMHADLHSAPHEYDQGWCPYLSNFRREQFGSRRQLLHLGRSRDGI